MKNRSRQRRVVTRSGARVRGFFNSLKSCNRIAWESPLEKKALLVWEFDSTIIRIESHQSQVLIEGWDVPFSTYPDFELTYQDGRTVTAEVKSEWALQDESVRDRLDKIRRHFASREQEYRVITDTEICQEPRLSTLYTLLPLRRRVIRQQLQSCLFTRRRLAELPSGTMPFDEVVRHINDGHTAMRLLANGLLTSDWSCRLGSCLPVAVNAEVLS